ncbi:MAG: hemerythrin domain-containing protein [Magnetococcales bacterium]|nr:hemerythrin domain-containing protein [Magnetococcales bacterium]
MDNTVLDLSGLNPETRLERLTAAFEGMKEGGDLEVVCDAELSAALRGLQGSRWGGFDWRPVEKGPVRWRVRLHRGYAGGKTRGIGAFMGEDHEWCDTLFAAMENAVIAGDMEKARGLFGMFEVGMAHHFDMEEKRFFPAFEQATGMTQGPTTVMRMEHRQMLGVIAQMRQAVDQGDASGVTRGGSTLMVLMRQHNIKEEQMLYPMGDMHLGDVQPLLQAMQAV